MHKFPDPRAKYQNPIHEQGETDEEPDGNPARMHIRAFLSLPEENVRRHKQDRDYGGPESRAMIDRHFRLVRNRGHSIDKTIEFRVAPGFRQIADGNGDHRALWSWIVCVVVTIAVSYLTKPRSDA